MADDNFITKDYTQHSDKIMNSHFTFQLDYSIHTYKTDHQFAGIVTETGATSSIVQDDTAKYWGPNIGIGYRWFLNHRLSFALQGDLFYYALKKEHIQKYSESFPETVMEKENKNHMFGGKVSPKLIYRIPIKNQVYFEPYILGHIGYGMVKGKFDFSYNDLETNASFTSKVKESFLTTGLGLGFNIMGKNGLYVYLQGIKSFLSIGSSTIKTSTSAEMDLDVDTSRSEFSGSLGFGYVF